MKFGLPNAHYQFILNTVVQPLARQGATIWCYGSRARGDHKPFSDLDLMVESDDDLSSEIGRIRQELENSNFPFKVEIVPLREFASSYVPGYQKDKVRFD